MQKPTVAAAKVPTNIPPVRFVREVIAELKKVTWPTPSDTIKLTLMVIAVSVAVGLYIGTLDIVLIQVQKMLFN